MGDNHNYMRGRIEIAIKTECVNSAHRICRPQVHMDFDVKCESQMQNLKTQVLNHCCDDETSCVKEETHQCAKGVLCFTSFVTNQE